MNRTICVKDLINILDTESLIDVQNQEGQSIIVTTADTLKNQTKLYYKEVLKISQSGDLYIVLKIKTTVKRYEQLLGVEEEQKSNTDKAVEIIVEEIRNDVEGNYRDWDIESWQEYLDAIGLDSKDFKEEVHYMLSHSEINGTGFMKFTDDCEIIEEDGTVVSYRTLMNKVRKEMNW